jgi:hypothetical protein
LPDSFAQFAVDPGHLRLIGIDTVVPVASYDAICATRIADLEQTFQAHRPDLPLSQGSNHLLEL